MVETAVIMAGGDMIRPEHLPEQRTVSGEGERVVPELIDWLSGVRTEPPAEGLIVRDGERVIVPSRPGRIGDLDTLPFPDYAAVGYERYLHDYRPAVDAPRAFPSARLCTSRGCPHGCIFCQVGDIAGRRTRFQSADRVLAELTLVLVTMAACIGPALKAARSDPLEIIRAA